MPEKIRQPEEGGIDSTGKKRNAKKITARTFLEKNVEALAFYFAYGYQKSDDATLKRLDKHIESAINAAFKACRLDVTFDDADDPDFIVATMLLAVAVFGPPGKGAPEIWNSSRLAHLDKLFKDRKRRDPGKQDIEYFNAIAKSDEFPKIKNRNKRPSGAALQRQLQMARKEGLI